MELRARCSNGSEPGCLEDLVILVGLAPLGPTDLGLGASASHHSERRISCRRSSGLNGSQRKFVDGCWVISDPDYDFPATNQARDTRLEFGLDDDTLSGRRAPPLNRPRNPTDTSPIFRPPLLIYLERGPLTAICIHAKVTVSANT